MGGSLALADRLFDYTVAGTLLARWYTRKGRFLEASHEAACESSAYHLYRKLC